MQPKPLPSMECAPQLARYDVPQVKSDDDEPGMRGCQPHCLKIDAKGQRYEMLWCRRAERERYGKVVRLLGMRDTTETRIAFGGPGGEVGRQKALLMLMLMVLLLLLQMMRHAVKVKHLATLFDHQRRKGGSDAHLRGRDADQAQSGELEHLYRRQINRAQHADESH